MAQPIASMPHVRVARPIRFPSGRGAGQRSAERRGLAATASVREAGTADVPLPLAIIEVSATGAFVQSDLLLPVGAQLELQFDIPGRSDSLAAEGRVVRVEDRGNKPGMGIIFDKMSGDARAHLREFTAWN